MLPKLPKSDVVLLGVGHTNAHVLRQWRMNPLPDARLTCISNFSIAMYSGMLPGTLAGLYEPDRMQIDLVRLCAAAGARLIVGETIGLDVPGRQVLMADRPPVPFDALSIGVGSTPRLEIADYDPFLALLIKPMQTFLPRLDAWLAAWAARRRPHNAPLRVAVAGAGAGGIEIAFCLPPRVAAACGALCEVHLIDRNSQLLTAMPARVSRCVRRALEAKGVRLWLGKEVAALRQGAVTFRDGERLPVDLVLWATSAVAPPVLASLGLPAGSEGFLLTEPTLKSTADAPIFVVGDSGYCQQRPTPRAGVYAVRQGPILWENLGRTLRGEPLIEYRPQRGFLSLLATGDGRAIMAYKGFSAHAGWCWRLKDRIDTRFMRMYQDYQPRMGAAVGPASPQASAAEADAMRCTGCGGKVGAGVLRNALARLEIPASPHVLQGLERPDDAALYQPAANKPVLATVDFFAAFVDDPYLVGRVAALNSLSDVFACRGVPRAALAMATLPLGPARKQEQMLYELLAGALREFRQCGATIMGGHTIEGPQLTVGFTVLGDARSDQPGWKAGLRAGDLLVLTKPLGSGILLAAHGRAACRAEWMDALVPMLTASNQRAAEIAEEFDVSGITDVTGFGLAGHLLEMLDASGVGAELDLRRLPLLAGVLECLNRGIESTLAPANRQAETRLGGLAALLAAPGGPIGPYRAIFDPQTSGGLLVGVRATSAERFCRQVAESAGQPAVVIGQVTPRQHADQPLRVVG